METYGRVGQRVDKSLFVRVGSASRWHSDTFVFLSGDSASSRPTYRPLFLFPIDKPAVCPFKGPLCAINNFGALFQYIDFPATLVSLSGVQIRFTNKNRTSELFKSQI